MNKEIKSRIKHKKDTDENWINKNPILLDGEIVIVDHSDGIKLKVGDGNSNYSQLSFINIGGGTSASNTVETWTFTLTDGSTVLKQVVVG